jgi:hypothetical protein
MCRTTRTASVVGSISSLVLSSTENVSMHACDLVGGLREHHDQLVQVSFPDSVLGRTNFVHL